MDPEQKLFLLQQQKERLCSQLHLQKHEIKSLESKVTHLEKIRTDGIETVLSVNRFCKQLGDDLLFLCRRAKRFQDVESIVKKEPDGAAGEPNQFVQSLLRGASLSDSDGDAVTKVETDGKDDNNADRILSSQAASTSGLMSQLLSLMDSEEEATRLLVEHAKKESADEALKQRVDKAMAQCSALQATIDKQYAKLRTAKADQKEKADKLWSAEKRCQSLSNELAERDEQLTLLKKKVFDLKNRAASSTGDVNGPTLRTSSAPISEALEMSDGDRAEVEKLREAIARRDADAEQTQALLQSLREQLQACEAKLQDEKWVVTTRAWQLQAKEVAQMRTNLGNALEQIVKLQGERDISLSREMASRLKADQYDVLRQRCLALEGRVVEAEASHKSLMEERHKLQMQLHQERERFGVPKTAKELNLAAETLRKEIGMLQAKLQRAQAAQTQLDEQKAASEAMTKKLAAAEQQLQRQQGELKQVRQANDKAQQEREELLTQVKELMVFVEVLTTFCDDPRDLAECRRSEVLLQQQVQELQAKGQSPGDRKAAAAEKRAEASAAELEQLRRERDELQLDLKAAQRDAAGLKQQLAQAKEEAEAYVSEILATGKAYEDTCTQNMRLLKQLTENDETNSGLLAERLKLTQANESSQVSLQQAQEGTARSKQDLDLARSQMEIVEARCHESMAELTQLREMFRSASSQHESTVQQLQEKDLQLQQFLAQEEAAQQAVAAANKRADELERALAKEGQKRQRLDDERAVLQGRLDALQGTAGGTTVAEIKETQEEVESLRRMLKCSVCNTRQKSVVLSKCWHMFCAECIRKNVETRNRKCPGCATPFGLQDVHQLYF